MTRLNPNTGAASVQFATSDGTNQNTALNAVNQIDYVATNGVLTFLNGQASNSFTVTILNQNVVESNKTFNVSLSNPQVLTLPNPSTNAYLLSPSNATVTITDVLAGVSFESPSFTVSECGVLASIPVILTGVTNNLVSVNYTTTNGTAFAGTNYFATNGSLTFLPGQTSTNIYVQVINDHIIGPDHTVILTLSNPQGAQLLNPSTAVLTIQECNGAYIVKSGTAFVSGSTPNNAGVIFSNEAVRILFGLRDVAGNNTTNLVATLLATNGVTTNVSRLAAKLWRSYHKWTHRGQAVYLYGCGKQRPNHRCEPDPAWMARKCIPMSPSALPWAVAPPLSAPTRHST